MCISAVSSQIFTPPLHLVGSPFRQAVWTLLLQIPYGQTTTYGALAQQLAAQTGAAGYPPRRWAGPWATTRSPSSSPATALWAQTVA